MLLHGDAFWPTYTTGDNANLRGHLIHMREVDSARQLNWILDSKPRKLLPFHLRKSFPCYLFA